MSYIIYVDNFRGFNDTYIPLENINFFVGENSTGKTSIISLIKLFSTSDFWLNNSFSYEDEINFGHFHDIVSANTKDKSYFSIGYIHNDKNKINSFLITYKNIDGVPEPKFIVSFRNNIKIQILLTKKTIKYKYDSKLEFKNNVDNFIKKYFSVWKNSHKSDTKGYTTLPIPKLPIPFLLTVAESAIKINTNEKITKKDAIEARKPFLIENIVWLAPIRTKPKRTYDEYKFEFSPSGDHTPHLIKKLLSKKTEAEKFKKFLNEIGKSSGLFQEINITKYGRGATAPFEVDIKLNDNLLNINNVGYGVSQILPVIVESFARPKKSWFAIQQPEVHLHPKAQAALGDMFFELATLENKNFLIETHSDYTIDRFRLNFQRKIKTNISSQLLYFERTKDGNKLYILKIDENGNLPKEQPKSYRDFFVKEEIELLGF